MIVAHDRRMIDTPDAVEITVLLAVSSSLWTSTCSRLDSLVNPAVGWKVNAPVVVTITNSPPTLLVSVSTVSVCVT